MGMRKLELDSPFAQRMGEAIAKAIRENYPDASATYNPAGNRIEVKRFKNLWPGPRTGPQAVDVQIVLDIIRVEVAE
jgi:hypothetical protein